MSSTTLYAIATDGELTTFAEYRNSHGSAMAIWRILAPKYVAGVPPRGTPWAPDQRGIFDDGVMKELWDFAIAGGMEEFERRTIWTTFDRACIRIEDVPVFADALAKFAEVYGPEEEQAQHVFHIGTQAADLRRLFDERETRGWRGVTWNQTSCGDAYSSMPPTDEMRERLFVERLAEDGLIDGEHITGTPQQVAEIAAAMCSEAQSGDDIVWYNVDHFDEHFWLPGAGVDRLKD